MSSAVDLGSYKLSLVLFQLRYFSEGVKRFSASSAEAASEEWDMSDTKAIRIDKSRLIFVEGDKRRGEG